MNIHLYSINKWSVELSIAESIQECVRASWCKGGV